MRTAIFVYTESQLSIATSEEDCNLERLGGEPTSLGTSRTLQLEAGIYKVVSSAPISVVANGPGHVEIVIGNLKDDMPEPKPRLQTRAGAVDFVYDRTAFWEFFPMARELVAP